MRGSSSGRSRLMERLRGPLRIAVALAVLGLLNLYVLYWRRGTSMPELWNLASQGRRAALSTRLQGPPGTPPAPSRSLRRNKPLPPLPDYPRVIEIALKPGDTMLAVISPLGLPARVQTELLATLQTVLDPGGLGAGQTLTLFLDADDRLQSVDYRLTPTLAYHLEKIQTGSADHFVSSRQLDPLQVRQVALAITLNQPGDLVAATQRAGETAALAARLQEIFTCEINLLLEARPGDKLRLVVEKYQLGSRFYRYGRLLAAEYVPAPGGSRTSRIRAFLSPGMVASNAGAAQGAATSYFTETGDSLARVQCRSPLQWSRSFGQASAEPAVRPVLHAERSRLGLDYPAAVGMPVLAAGSGKVVAHGPRPGVGNTVVLAHPGGTETIYQHLSRIPRSLVDGQQVKFRQVIGYVGQTGPVPKPHLHFAVRVGNRLIDPTKWRPAREVPLPDSKRVALAESVAELSELMVRAGESSPDAGAASSQLAAALPSQP